MVLALPPWASGGHALDKHTIPTELGKKMPSGLARDPDLKLNGARLLWASITSGRPPTIVPTVFDASNAAYRQWRIWASLGMVEPDGYGSLRRTATFSDLDPTEKGHLNYALAGALTKAYAGLRLDSPWLAHMSLATVASYNIQFNASTSRPDYFGVTYQGKFIVAEAKGRIYLRADLKKQLDKKVQTGAVSTLAGPGKAKTTPAARYGVAAATGGKNLRLYVTDPDEDLRGQPDPNDWIRAYYNFLIQLADVVNADDPEGSGPFGAGESTQGWQRVRFVVPDLARRWAHNEGSPIEEWHDSSQLFIDTLRRDIAVSGPNPDLTYFATI